MLTISKVRGWLYGTAKTLGDVQAAKKAMDTGDLEPIKKRLVRRLAGKITGRLLGRLFR